MSYHCRDALKNLFGRKAVETVNLHSKILNALCCGEGLRLDKPDEPSSDKPVRMSVNAEALRKVLDKAEGTDDPTQQIPVTDAATGAMPADNSGDTAPISGDPIWERGDGKKYKEKCVLAIEEDPNTGAHRLWYCTKEYTPDGRLSKVGKIEDYAWIGA